MQQGMRQIKFGSEEVSKIGLIKFVKGGVQKIVSIKRHTISS